MTTAAALTISELWRYPVKSVGGERLATATVTELGIEGDRCAGIVDLETGMTLTARRAPELLFASARFTELGSVELTLPDGTVTADDAVLSEWLGRPVRLAYAGEDGGTYEVPLDFENDADWVSWTGPGGAFHDSTKTRVSLVSRSTLGAWDQRRFRTNVILDGEGEETLVGHQATLGPVTLDVRKQIDRCVIVTRPQPGLERDLDVLRTINRERESFLGIGALIVTGGSVTTGDTLRTV